MERCGFPEELGLTDLSGITKANIVIWEYMGTIGSGHIVELARASLWQDHRSGRANGLQVGDAGIPAGTNNVPIPFEHRMKGNDKRFLPSLMDRFGRQVCSAAPQNDFVISNNGLSMQIVNRRLHFLPPSCAMQEKAQRLKGKKTGWRLKKDQR